MFGDEVDMVDEAHGLFEARMQKSLRELDGLKRFEFSYHGGARRPKFIEQILHISRVVIGFVRFTILQVGGRQVLFTFHEIVHTRTPERFKIKEMADLFLCGPFFFFACD